MIVVRSSPQAPVSSHFLSVRGPSSHSSPSSPSTHHPHILPSLVQVEIVLTIHSPHLTSATSESQISVPPPHWRSFHPSLIVLRRRSLLWLLLGTLARLLCSFVIYFVLLHLLLLLLLEIGSLLLLLFLLVRWERLLIADVVDIDVDFRELDIKGGDDLFVFYAIHMFELRLIYVYHLQGVDLIGLVKLPFKRVLDLFNHTEGSRYCLPGGGNRDVGLLLVLESLDGVVDVLPVAAEALLAAQLFEVLELDPDHVVLLDGLHLLCSVEVFLQVFPLFHSLSNL